MDLRLIITTILVLCFVNSSVYAEFSVPERIENSYWCTDYQGDLADYASSLSFFFATFLADKNMEYTVAVFPDLQGELIEDVATKVFNQWELGRDNDSRGLLLCVDAGMKQSRFEVGYGLEHLFTDAFCSFLVRNSLRELFDDQISPAILQTLMLTIISRLSLEEDHSARAIFQEWENNDFRDIYYSGGAGAQASMEKDYLNDSEIDEKYHSNYLPQDTPLKSLEVLKRVLEDRVKDERLDLYAEGFFWDLFASIRMLASLREEGNYQVYQLDRYAVVKPADSNSKAWPFFFVQGDDGLWRYDMVTLMQNSHLEKNGKLVISTRMSSGHPYMFAYGASDQKAREFQKKHFASSITAVKSRIEQKQKTSFVERDYSYYIELGDLHFELGETMDGHKAYDKALELNPYDAQLFAKVAEREYDYKYRFLRAYRYYKKAYELSRERPSKLILKRLSFLSAYFSDGKASLEYLTQLDKLYPVRNGSAQRDAFRALAYRRLGDKKNYNRYMDRASRGNISSKYLDYISRVASTTREKNEDWKSKLEKKLEEWKLSFI